MGGLPILYGTGINTYLWILSNKKPDNRKGFIQLIDASDMKTPMRNIGNKRFEMTDEQRAWVVKAYVNGEVNEHSVIIPTTDLMFRKVTTYRPLRAVIKMTKLKIMELIDSKPLNKLSIENKNILEDFLTEALHGNAEVTIPYESVESITAPVRRIMIKPEMTNSAIAKAVRDVMTEKGSNYPVIRDKKGNIVPDKDMKDTENIPFGMSFDSYMASEVLPYAPETWIDESVTDSGPLQDGKVGVVGTNISFNKYFYHYEEPRNTAEISKEIMELESGLEEFMKEFLI